jgi:hypothetical protein
VYRGGHYLISAALGTGETIQLFHQHAMPPGQQIHICLTGHLSCQGFPAKT